VQQREVWAVKTVALANRHRREGSGQRAMQPAEDDNVQIDVPS